MSYLKDSPMAGGSVGTTSVGVVNGGSAMVGFIVGAEIGSIIPCIEKTTTSLIYENKYLIIYDGDNKLCQTEILKGFRRTFYSFKPVKQIELRGRGFLSFFLREKGLKADLSKLSFLSSLLTKGNGTLLFNFLSAKSNNICASDQSQSSISLQCSTF